MLGPRPAPRRDPCQGGHLGLDHIEVVAADRQLVAVQEPSPVDRLAIDEQAVEAAVVEHPQRLFGLPDDQAVAPRDGWVVEAGVGRDAASDPRPATLQAEDLDALVAKGKVSTRGVDLVARLTQPFGRRRLGGDRKLSRRRLVGCALEHRGASEALAAAAGAIGKLILSFQRNLGAARRAREGSGSRRSASFVKLADGADQVARSPPITDSDATAPGYCVYSGLDELAAMSKEFGRKCNIAAFRSWFAISPR